MSKISFSFRVLRLEERGPRLPGTRVVLVSGREVSIAVSTNTQAEVQNKGKGGKGEKRILYASFDPYSPSESCYNPCRDCKKELFCIVDGGTQGANPRSGSCS